MRRAFGVALMALACWPLAAAAQEPIRAGYRANSDVALRIWVPTGLVRVVAWDRDSVDVGGTNGKRGRFFGGGAAGQMKLGIEPLDPLNPALPGADITVRVPRRARVWVKMTTGHVDAEGIAGELEVSVVGGSVDVRNAEGVIAIESIDAPVHVSRASGALRIRGGRGTVTLTQAGGTASIATVSGDVLIGGTAALDATIETIGGAITAPVRGTLDLQTHSGTITLAVDPGRALSMLLTARQGTVRNSFRIAKGPPTVTARSFRGDINVVPLVGVKGGK
ncbi:MAG: hypothetical protein H0W15_01370 [Gemmatimonadales bacterium]|nr:hypothetical protein [Gemmatimonadales bacterium]